MNKIFIISGSPGVGKTTLVNKIIKNRPDKFVKVITSTTRPPRENELNHKDYHFYSKNEFEIKISNNDFIEYTTTLNNYYGIEKTEFDLILNKMKKNAIMILDPKGLISLSNKFSRNIFSIYILPPSYMDLSERLLKRGTNNDELLKRMDVAFWEIPHIKYYDYLIVNDNLDQCMIQLIEKLDKCTV